MATFISGDTSRPARFTLYALPSTTNLTIAMTIAVLTVNMATFISGDTSRPARFTFI